jgi:hypothetical protein
MEFLKRLWNLFSWYKYINEKYQIRTLYCFLHFKKSKKQSREIPNYLKDSVNLLGFSG